MSCVTLGIYDIPASNIDFLNPDVTGGELKLKQTMCVLTGEHIPG